MLSLNNVPELCSSSIMPGLCRYTQYPHQSWHVHIFVYQYLRRSDSRCPPCSETSCQPSRLEWCVWSGSEQTSQLGPAAWLAGWHGGAAFLLRHLPQPRHSSRHTASRCLAAATHMGAASGAVPSSPTCPVSGPPPLRRHSRPSRRRAGAADLCDVSLSMAPVFSESLYLPQKIVSL